MTPVDWGDFSWEILFKKISQIEGILRSLAGRSMTEHATHSQLMYQQLFKLCILAPAESAYPRPAIPEGADPQQPAPGLRNATNPIGNLSHTQEYLLLVSSPPAPRSLKYPPDKSGGMLIPRLALFEIQKHLSLWLVLHTRTEWIGA